MYAAAGGASLASRQARRNIRKQQQSSDVVHQQFKRRFELLQAQHAPAATSELFHHHHHHHPHASFLDLHHARLPALSSQDISEVSSSFSETPRRFFAEWILFFQRDPFSGYYVNLGVGGD